MKPFDRFFPLVSLLLAILILPACGTKIIRGDRDSGPAPGSVDVTGVPDAVPRVEPPSKYGNPESYVVNGKRYYVRKNSTGFVERGIASWYGEKFHGRRTSSGETYDMYAMTAAHKSLPLPTYVQVTNLKNGRSIVVRVNDRGPFHENRIIDLSYTGAAKLDIIRAGTGLVEVRAIDPRTYRPGGAPVLTGTPGPERGGFFIQVGAFAELMNAERLRQRLGVLGQQLVQIREAVVNGNRLYRVQLGPLQDVSQADSLVAQFARLGIVEHHIVLD